MPGGGEAVATLDQRIAAALSDDVTASDLEALVAEVEGAAAEAEEVTIDARTRALDPLTVDATAACAAMNDAEFTRDRLQTALPQLQARQREVAAAERYRKWATEHDEAAAEQRALAQELTELYPPFEAKIVDLLLRIEKADNRAIHLDFYKPKDANYRAYDDGRDLRRTEQLARSGGGLSIMKDMKLPAWAGNIVASWPPWRPMVSIAASYALPAPPCTPEQIAARDAARQAEAEKMADFYKRQERAREEREAAEARAAQERDIERRREAGWS
jgi:hypothetical protein